MKTHMILLLLACKTVVSVAQGNDGKTPYLTKSLANNAINSVVVQTSAGGIAVSGQSGQAPRVEVYIRGNNGRVPSKEEIQELLKKDYDLNITVNGHEVSATAKSRHNFAFWKRSLSISFKIYVPQQTATDLKTSGGGIQLDNLKGNEIFSTSGGGLQIDRLTGIIRGSTSGGGIEVSNSGNDISLSTSGGGITAKNCNGRIKLETSGGGIQLNNLKGTINANTSGGGVEGGNIDGELITSTSGGGIDLKQISGSLNAETSGGDLSAQVLKLGKYVKLHASGGNVDLELPSNQGFNLSARAQGINDRPSKANFNGKWEKRSVEGTVNGGGASVEAHASSGNFNIQLK
jgi:DUF4097 and DUF4098 domain-containing protein YvlB